MKEVDKSIEQIVSSLNKDFLSYIKNYFEKNFSSLIGDGIELRLVVDANILISEILAYIKKGRFFLLQLSESPFLRLLAPTWLADEVRSKVPKLAKKKRLDESELEKIAEMALNKINYVGKIDEKSISLACQKIGYRDFRDVPYAALHFSVKCHGIMTRDKHFEEVREIKVWKSKGLVGKVVSLLEEGTFSFFIMTEGVPQVLQQLYAIAVAILTFVWKVIQQIANAISKLVKRFTEEVKKLPEWLKIVLGISAVFLIMWDKSRDAILKGLRELSNMIGRFAKSIYNAFKRLLEVVAFAVGISITVLSCLFQHFSEAIDTLRDLDSALIEQQNTLVGI